MITTEEIIKALQKGLPMGYDLRDEIASIVEKSDKYKWHDLHEDPKDLPPMGKCIFVAFDIDDKEYYDLSVFGDYKWTHLKIKAWRLIEPYKGKDL